MSHCMVLAGSAVSLSMSRSRELRWLRNLLAVQFSKIRGDLSLQKKSRDRNLGIDSTD